MTPQQAAEIVTTTERLTEVVRYASEFRLVGLDIESNGFHRYPERICLVQMAVEESVFLLDPLKIPDMSALGHLLTDPLVEKVLHSADYDLRSLDRDWGFRISNLFDTSIAAAFAGSTSLGLAAVLREYLGVEVPKSKRLQRSDWTIRPLSTEALRYAASDVLHLKRARDLLVNRLDSLSRLAWVKEECKRLAGTRYRPPDVEWGFLSMKGSRTLDARGLAVLRSLHRFREREAVRKDRPPFKVLSDTVLISLASKPHSILATVQGIGRYGRGTAAKALQDAIYRGAQTDPITPPRRKQVKTRRPRPSERDKSAERLRYAKTWRTEQGLRLGLDPALLWPAKSLERIAACHSSVDEECESVDVRLWQRREFGESLRSFLGRLD